MQKILQVTDMKAYEILDSRGRPTIEVLVAAGENYIGRAKVPSGASTGMYEAVELRDRDERYKGMGVKKAVENINAKISREIMGMNVFEQRKIDGMLRALDGTEDKRILGANAILGVSMAVARAAAAASGLSLYRYLGGCGAHRIPVPMMNVVNGGRHADNRIDIQEFMIMPVGACCFKEGLRMCVETYMELKEILKQKGYSTAVGDEGGFAPDVESPEEVLDIMTEAVKKAGYQPGNEISFAMDVAASELYDDTTKKYYFPGESRGKEKMICRTSEEMLEYYDRLISKYPLISLEDGLGEEDWAGWKALTKRFEKRLQLVGDDLFVTNKKRIKYGIDQKAANALLVKPNQIGTLTETFDAARLARSAGYDLILSHRSGDTEDPVIADIAVAMNAGQIKAGAPCRAERVSKYNRLLQIEESLENESMYENPFTI